MNRGIFPVSSCSKGAALLLALLLLLSGCAASEAPQPEIPGPSEACPTLYVFAPGYLIVDLAAGSDILLDPGAREFQVFCSPRAAHDALILQVSQGRLPRGDWQIFALKGGYDELGRAKSPGSYVLRTQARLASWCREQDF